MKSFPASALVFAQLCALVLAFAADRLSKNWMLNYLEPVNVKPFIDGFMQLHLTHNTGAAFSLGQSNGMVMTAVAAAVTIAVGAWAVWRHRILPGQLPLEKIGTGLLLGGALGNLFDRFTVGQVTDFLQFTFIDFPIFNVADSLIDVGIGLIFIDLMISGKSLTTVSNEQGESADDKSKAESDSHA